MTDSAALRRFPSHLRGGNGIKVTYSNNVPTISADLDTLSVTPAGAAAPVQLATELAYLIENNPGTSNITLCDGGFFDVPGSDNGVTCDGGSF